MTRASCGHNSEGGGGAVEEWQPQQASSLHRSGTRSIKRRCDRAIAVPGRERWWVSTAMKCAPKRGRTLPNMCKARGIFGGGQLLCGGNTQRSSDCRRTPERAGKQHCNIYYFCLSRVYYCRYCCVAAVRMSSDVRTAVVGRTANGNAYYTQSVILRSIYSRSRIPAQL